MSRLATPMQTGTATALSSGPIAGARRSRLGMAVRSLMALALVVILVCVLLSGYVGWQLTHPARNYPSPTPAALGLSYSNVQFPSQQGNILLRGWFLPAGASTRTVIMAHGYRGHRFAESGSLLLAAALVHHGFNVLAFDFRGEGQSQGTLVSIGQDERYDVLGAVQYLNRRFAGRDPHIGVLGFSMGAATALLTAPLDTRDIRAVVSDSSFADLYSYLEDHISTWSHLPSVPFNALILWETPLLTGLDPHKVSPIAAVRALPQTPVLFIAGLADNTIPYSDTVRLAQAATDPADTLWLVPGADHTKAYQVQPRAYERRVLAFFSRYLG
ncbi:MAG TPA: alpha/beta fold hydrolase [Chloroflexota bacterium]|jgi:alpha-beta hydrolase superfamily lysophospholipase|nr:alpha/beta fold hydrolase [Chloroflexota bacterium]